MAGNIARGRPVAYRVTVNYSGPGPGFHVDSKGAIIVGCAVFGPLSPDGEADD